MMKEAFQGIDAPQPQMVVRTKFDEATWYPKNRKQRRASASIIRRLGRAIERARRTFDKPGGEQARVHVASLWKRYAALSGDISVL